MSLDKGIVGTLDKAQPVKVFGYNGKIADITQPDTDDHFLDLTGITPANTIGLFVMARRMGGSGYFKVYSNEGSEKIPWSSKSIGEDENTYVHIKNNRLKYCLTSAGSDWDVHLYGYVTE